jgi:hypothetical protein
MLCTVVGSVATASSESTRRPLANAELIDCYRRTRHDVDVTSRGLVSRGLADHRIHQLGPEGALGSRESM